MAEGWIHRLFDRLRHIYRLYSLIDQLRVYFHSAFGIHQPSMPWTCRLKKTSAILSLVTSSSLSCLL